MDVKNYYFILELSIDPPENDPKVIEDAIQKKQALWSRLRNHPTKGTQAQHYMGLIPEIRKIMMDDALRKKEAEAAKDLLIEHEKKSNIKIDRHIALLLSKGHITNDEISKLACLNGVSRECIQERLAQKQHLFLINYVIEELIRTGKTDPKYHKRLIKEFALTPEKASEWIQKKEDEKRRKIDTYLKRCNRRGYIARQEITALSRLYLISEDNIVRRIRCVIKKNASPLRDRPEPLEKSTEKLIEDNLKLVGKSSLYDFLDVLPSADLSILQERAHDKEIEIRKIGQKDARTTAGGTLAGHCIFIFKSEENRSAYDRSLTLSRLKELEADMDITGISKKIHAEYFSILMKNALKLGMDIDEARLHIEGYLRKRNRKIEKPKPFIAKRRPVFLRPIPIIAAMVLVSASVFFFITAKKKLLAQEFRNVIARSEQLRKPEQKETIFRAFLEKYPKSDFTPEVESMLLSVQKIIEDRDYHQVLTESETLIQSGQLPMAKSLFRRYLEKYPGGHHQEAAKTRLLEITNTLEERNYKILQEKLTDCEAQETWRDCIILCSHFIERYPQAERTENVAMLKTKYEKILQSQSELVSMKQDAEKKGLDFEGARQIYLSYLELNPELPLVIKKSIVDEIRRYDRQIETFKQAERNWKRLSADIPNDRSNLTKRIQDIRSFISKYPQDWFGEEARYLLIQMEKLENLKNRQHETEREIHDWKAVTTYVQDRRTSLSNRIARVETFIRNHPQGSYTPKAKIILAALVKHKQIEERQRRRDMSNAVLKSEEKHRISQWLRSAGISFIDNKNGTATDRRTGLTWCLFDTTDTGNQCITHREALQYVKNLNAGGYNDWRIPSVEELQIILQAQTPFPVNRTHFFWTSELFWHGWNKMAYVFTPDSTLKWKKESKKIENCGSVLAVR